MNNLESIQQLLEQYIQGKQQSRVQINKLKQVLYVNPLLIYGNEDKWKENQFKLKHLTSYNQGLNIFKNTAAYFAAIHLFGLINIKISKQYSLRQAWAMNFCRKTFMLPGLAYLFYTNFVLDNQQLFEQEIQKLKQLPKDQEYLYSEHYVKEKYFRNISKKLDNLCKDSYRFANTQKQQEEIQYQNNNNNSEASSPQQSNKKQNQIQIAKTQQKNKELSTDDYYFEINEVIEELEEENFFD
ncbi:hypothetical protein TTHERM_00685960 (macronuclear) [Tetrahymena thermophila SB210]|uniref:Uncharacterized protein n=1 Tax=Tetrahymena thermophila (strain SB210) TaxID=312017 RepID=I7MAN7_TETTS|nr:hypothetical protein TTHERM_00685960 [Tetrahymena thermophila SB210]EAS04953.1 hypothetical protein TTHERM_00685960 [Tetrahymena thermophila SB210]|eukprot:XP_001025198.1 hypothetical protein TTHERM_00685960 [Tetrahymena thermophila SB210]